MTYWVSAIHVNQNKIEIKTNFSKSRLFCMKGNNEQFQPYFAKFNIPYSRENKQCLFKTHAVFGRAYFRAFSKFILYFAQF